MDINYGLSVTNSADTKEAFSTGNYGGIADNILAKHFYSLSFQDRNDINEEIHGVGSMSVPETPELVETSLRQLAIELHNLPSRYRLLHERASRMIYHKKAKNKSKNSSSEDSVYGRARAEANNISSEGVNNNNENALFERNNHSPSSQDCTSSSFCYVKSREFQLVFLRCEFFNARKAAMRLGRYLDLVVQVYGEEALRRPLRIEDLNSREELEVISAGHQQLLPFRDKSGRRVLALHGDLSLPRSSLLARSVLSRGPAMKLILYLWSVLMEDVEAQRSGLVVVYWPRYVNHRVGQGDQGYVSHRVELEHLEEGKRDKEVTSNDNDNDSDSNGMNQKRAKLKSRRHKKRVKKEGSTNTFDATPPDAESRSLGVMFFQAVPVRVCAIHCCFPDTPFFRMIRYVFLFILGENFRTRMKTHQGHGTEVLYSLMGYGIPVDTLPLDEITQTVKTKNQAAFVKVRRRIEAEYHHDLNRNRNNRFCNDSSDDSIESDDSKRCSIIECPSLNDVIFRAGKSYMSHPGNMMFRGLIENHIDEHNTASQDRKKSLTWEVINEVEAKDGRFLEYNRGLGTWTVLSDRNQIRHKIATYFKEYRRKIRAHQKTQMNQSSTHKFEVLDAKRRKRNPNKQDFCFCNTPCKSETRAQLQEHAANPTF